MAPSAVGVYGTEGEGGSRTSPYRVAKGKGYVTGLPLSPSSSCFPVFQIST